MIAIRNILCPYDGSEFSRRALEHAVALGRWYRARISLLNVHPGVPLAEEVARRQPPLDAAERKRIVAWLADVGSGARDVGVAVEAHVAEGRPTVEIQKLAKDLPADLLVMGTHGRTGFDRLLLGSVTEKVLRHSPCPVLVVTGRALPAYRPGRPPFERIVCPVDFSDSALRGVEYALSLAQAAYGRLTLMHALELGPPEVDPTLSRYDMGAYYEAMEETGRKRLEDILPVGARDWCRPECVVTRGKAYQAILDAAEERAADLIVIGVHGRNPIDLVLFGSTTNHVVRAARCPVLVVRSGASDV